MAVTTSDKAVTDYLDTLLSDSLMDAALTLPVDTPAPQQPAVTPRPRSADTTDVTRRMVPVFDPFTLMSLTAEHSLQRQHLMWIGVHELLPMIQQLPPSSLRQYCLRQCETLLRQACVDS